MDRDGGILEDLSGNPHHGHPLSPRTADHGHAVDKDKDSANVWFRHIDQIAIRR
jgi:hypothetical protein